MTTLRAEQHRLARSTWWVSTPQWTICVTHDGDRIVAIAPILRRRWLGKSWLAFGRWVRQMSPTGWRFQCLEGQETASHHPPHRRP